MKKVFIFISVFYCCNATAQNESIYDHVEVLLGKNLFSDEQDVFYERLSELYGCYDWNDHESMARKRLRSKYCNAELFLIKKEEDYMINSVSVYNFDLVPEMLKHFGIIPNDYKANVKKFKNSTNPNITFHKHSQYGYFEYSEKSTMIRFYERDRNLCTTFIWVGKEKTPSCVNISIIKSREPFITKKSIGTLTRFGDNFELWDVVNFEGMGKAFEVMELTASQKRSRKQLGFVKNENYDFEKGNISLAGTYDYLFEGFYVDMKYDPKVSFLGLNYNSSYKDIEEKFGPGDPSEKGYYTVILSPDDMTGPDNELILTFYTIGDNNDHILKINVDRLYDYGSHQYPKNRYQNDFRDNDWSKYVLKSGWIKGDGQNGDCIYRYANGHKMKGEFEDGKIKEAFVYNLKNVPVSYFLDNKQIKIISNYYIKKIERGETTWKQIVEQTKQAIVIETNTITTEWRKIGGNLMKAMDFYTSGYEGMGADEFRSALDSSLYYMTAVEGNYVEIQIALFDLIQLNSEIYDCKELENKLEEARLLVKEISTKFQEYKSAMEHGKTWNGFFADMGDYYKLTKEQYIVMWEDIYRLYDTCAK